MPSASKFKRLDWTPYEPLINDLAARAADWVETSNASVSEVTNTYADKLWCRLPTEFSPSVCKRMMRLAIVKHLCGETLVWKP